MISPSPSLTAPGTVPTRASIPMYRLLGTLGMLGSPFLLLSFAPADFRQNGVSRLGDALGLLFVLGWFGNILGLWALRATGQRRPGKILLGLELFAVALAGVYQVYEFVAPRADTVWYGIASGAWPLGMVLLIVIGVVVLRAHVLQDWTRFMPLACGLWFPLLVVSIKAIGAKPALITDGIYVMIAWFLLGYAIRNGGGAVSRG